MTEPFIIHDDKVKQLRKNLAKVKIEDSEYLEIEASQLIKFIKDYENTYCQKKTYEETIRFLNGILLNFDNLYIHGDFKYEGLFPCVIFNGSIFDGFVTFKNTTFVGETSFSGVTFTKITEFVNTKFIFDRAFAHFEGAKFNSKTFFTDVEINGYFWFNYAEFNYYGIFKNITCNVLEFEKAKLKDVSFENLICRGTGNFRSTKIEGGLGFRNANIEWVLDFSDLEGDSIYLSNMALAKLRMDKIQIQYFTINNVNINDIADFRGITFNEDIDFSENVVFNQADFSDATFKKKANFATCTFNTAPLFHNTKLHQDTSFEGTQFLRCSEEVDYRAYRTLKQHMNGVHAKLEENMFFALEQRTRRHLDAQDMRKNWFTVTISWFYDMISGYGQDLMRPVLWLVGISVLFAIIFSNANVEMAIANSDIKWTETIYPGWGYSFQNLNPLNMLSKDLPFKPTTFFVLILGYIESLLSVAFITLWLLAVRRRFQKGE